MCGVILDFCCSFFASLLLLVSVLCVCVELKKESGCIGLVVCVECEIFLMRGCVGERRTTMSFFFVLRQPKCIDVLTTFQNIEN